MKKRLRSIFISLLAAFMCLNFISAPVFATPAPSNPNSGNQKTEEEEDDGKTVLERIDEERKKAESKEGEEDENEENEEKKPSDCYKEVNGLGWLICPGTGLLSKLLDGTYGILQKLLLVNPISSEPDSPMRYVWNYFRGLTNLIFLILILIVVFSQVTGYGIKNYGIKRILPRIIVAAILVNLSYIICTLGVDLSNILGTSLRHVFENIGEIALENAEYSEYISELSATNVVSTLVGVGTGSVIAGLAFAGGIEGIIWMLILTLFTAAISVISAVVTIAARQSLIYLLIMISPLALVAYMLPNTESWFKKWYKLFTQLLVFFPTFSILYGASHLAGLIIFTSATDAFGIILGVAVQFVPLCMTIPMLRMSGTVLARIGGIIDKATKPASNSFRNYAKEHQALAKQKQLSRSNPSISGHLAQALERSKAERLQDLAELTKNNKDAYNAQAFASMLNDKNKPNSRGRRYYEMQARRMENENLRERTDATFDQGFNADDMTGNSFTKAFRARSIENANRVYDKAIIDKEINTARRSVITRNNAESRANKIHEKLNSQNSDIELQIMDTFNYDVNDSSAEAEKKRSQARNVVLANAIAAKRKVDKEALANYTELYDDMPPSSMPQQALRQAILDKDYNRMEAAIATMAKRGDYNQIEEVLFKLSDTINGDSVQDRAMQKHLLDTLIKFKDVDTKMQVWAKSNMMRRAINTGDLEKGKVPTINGFISFADFQQDVKLQGDSDEIFAKVSKKKLYKDIGDNTIVAKQDRTSLKAQLDAIKHGEIKINSKDKYIPLEYDIKQWRTSLTAGLLDGEKLDIANRIITLDCENKDLAGQSKLFKDSAQQVRNTILDLTNAMSSGQLAKIKGGTFDAFNRTLKIIDGEDYANENVISTALEAAIHDAVADLRKGGNSAVLGSMNTTVRKRLGL